MHNLDAGCFYLDLGLTFHICAAPDPGLDPCQEQELRSKKHLLTWSKTVLSMARLN
jgi:hypothetical protein